MAPHARRAKAVATCVQTFGAVTEGLVWLIDQGGNGTERGIAMELYASLNELTDRYTLLKRECMSRPPMALRGFSNH